ncbi:quinon protein alcohol dehydrogenase-like superfamily [Aspergillus tetrazonus]
MHFLHWLEVLALLGKGSDAVRKIRELWDYLLSSDGTMQSELRELSEVNILSLSPDAKFVAAAREYIKEVHLWDIATGAFLGILEVKVPDGAQRKGPLMRGPRGKAMWQGMKSLDFTTDGSRVFGAGVTGKVHIWDVATGAPVRTLTHRDVAAAEGSPEGKYIASGSKDGTIRIGMPLPLPHQQKTCKSRSHLTQEKLKP